MAGMTKGAAAETLDACLTAVHASILLTMAAALAACGADKSPGSADANDGADDRADMSDAESDAGRDSDADGVEENGDDPDVGFDGPEDAGDEDGEEPGCLTNDDCADAGGLCCDHVCVEADSCSFVVTDVSPAKGWLTGGDWLQLGGAGFARGMRVFVGEGRAPVRVVDSGHATIQTPPGPVGVCDVRIELSGERATLPGAFSYETLSLVPQWKTVNMAHARGRTPSLAVTQDGRVLVAGGTPTPGGFGEALTSAELFVPPPTEAFQPVGNEMSVGRCWATSVTLLTGKVLLVGGCWNSYSGGVVSDQADLFDPETNLFTPTRSPMNVARGGMTLAALLVDGRALVASGNDSTVEIYDPDTDSFELLSSAYYLHDGGFLVRLRDGRVLFGGGGMNCSCSVLPCSSSPNVEVFDSDTETFSIVGAMTTARMWTTAVALPDGRAIVLGGCPMCNPIEFTAAIDVFDPVANTFGRAPYSLHDAAGGLYAAVLVRDGTVLSFLGGTDVVDQIDPASETVSSSFAPTPTTMSERSAIRLLDGSVLLAGGMSSVCSDFIEYLWFDMW
jgi:hypothetical protein